MMDLTIFYTTLLNSLPKWIPCQWLCIQEENKRLFIETQLPTYISALDKLYQENGGDGWMVGDKVYV